MDHNANHVEEQHGTREVDPVRALKRIDPNTWSPERLEWLWETMRKQDYTCDDIGKEDPNYFLTMLFNPLSEHYEWKDDAYFALCNIVNGVGADFHHAVWGEMTMREVFSVHAALVKHGFDDLNLNRITSYIPSFNTRAIRQAIFAGYKYEGELREIFHKNGKLYNLQIYGLLKREFEQRKEK